MFSSRFFFFKTRFTRNKEKIKLKVDIVITRQAIKHKSNIIEIRNSNVLVNNEISLEKALKCDVRQTYRTLNQINFSAIKSVHFVCIWS